APGADAWRLLARGSGRESRCRPPVRRAGDESTHEPSDQRRSDPSSAAAHAGSPANWPDRGTCSECHAPPALDATRTRRNLLRSRTSLRLAGRVPEPYGCGLDRSIQAAPSHRMPLLGNGWSAWPRASENLTPNWICSTRLQQSSASGHCWFWRTECSPCSLPLVSPMRLMVDEN